MSVQPRSFAAVPDACLQVHLEALTLARLDAVLAAEQRAYSHPWTRGNFTDALACDYQTQVLMAGEQMLGYFVAMMGVDEVHLLNITVVPEFQRQGWARMMLDALTLWARGRSARWIWLEVRVSNLRAQHVYQAYGFRRVGERKHYYPAAQGQREDALLMRLLLVDPVHWHSRGPE